MKKTCHLLAALTVLVTAGAARAQDADAILGRWLNGEKTAQIEIYKEPNGKYSGKIVWLKEPIYPANDPKGMAGREKVDRENPNPKKRSQPILGLVILRNFVLANYNLRIPLDDRPPDPARWSDGQIYDPQNGKDYPCTLTLHSWDMLHERCTIGPSLYGLRQEWTRLKAGPQ